MKKEFRLRLTQRHHDELLRKLCKDDGLEAVCIALCGFVGTNHRTTLLVRELHFPPGSAYQEQCADRVRWSTEWMVPLLEKASAEGLSVLKVHSHPPRARGFSALDDASDREIFQSIHGWTDEVPLHASAVILPDGVMLARAYDSDANCIPAHKVTVIGDTIQFSRTGEPEKLPNWSQRNAQAFGQATISQLGGLKVGVVGCSGTGSFVVELLSRLGVGHLVLVDPGIVEWANLNRIIWATASDIGLPKVEVARRHIDALGLGTQTTVLQSDLARPDVVRALSYCDVLFGCVDSHDGRRLLNRISSFYLLPYIDVGVRLDADGRGGIEHISGAVHYIYPGGSSLLSRGAIDNSTASAEALRRADPEEYQSRLGEGYISGANESRPAVASVNGMFASMAVNELLLRLHDCRDDQRSYAQQRFIVSDPCLVTANEGPPCRLLSQVVGRGDIVPLLGLPELSVEIPGP